MLNRLSASGLKATSAEAYSKDNSTVSSEFVRTTYLEPCRTLVRYVFLRTVPSINLVKQKSIDDLCDLCWRVCGLYLIRIIPKDKLKAAFRKKVNGLTQCRRYGGSPTTACALPFWFSLIAGFGTSRNCKTAAMMVKGVITFKHNSPLKFSWFFAKLLATNCCT